MSKAALPSMPPPPRRLLGDLSGDSDGPLLIAVGSLHGNEPAGSLAIIRVMKELEESGTPLEGRFVGLLGNRSALEHGVRHIDRDLNRAWTPGRVAAILSGGEESPEDSEAAEQDEILSILGDLFSGRREPAHVLDLHTTSGEGPPFATVGDTLRNRSFAASLPLTMVLGVEELIDGLLLEYLNNLGHITLGFEAGQHLDPNSVEVHRAFLYLALERAGVLPPEAVPHRGSLVETMAENRHGMPRVFEVRHRHGITASDEFHMNPGWINFMPVERGEVLAQDHRGEIQAVESGIMLLPLYQGLGDDGFYLGRSIRPFWLWVSRVIRTFRLQALLPLLPGIRRSRGDSSALLVSKRVARWYAQGLFHLCGYRKRRDREAYYLFERRRENCFVPQTGPVS